MKNYCINILYIFALLVFICGCEKSTTYEDGITVELKLSHEVLSIDDTLEGVFSIINNSQDTKSFYFVNSCQFEYRIALNGKIQYYEPTGCRESQTEIHILSGESKTFEIIYSLIDNEGNDLLPGNYEIEALLIDTGYEVSQNFKIN